MTIDENSGFGQAVGSVTTNDVDAGDTFTYALTDSAGGRFAIDNSGNITVANPACLDYEDEASHSIEIEVTDIAGGTYRETIIVSLNDLDEFDVGVPVDSDVTANQVNENTTGATAGIVASAIDADETNNTIAYYLTDDDSGRFAIDQTTGIVTTATFLNFETQPSNGTLTQLPDGSIIYTPNLGFFGTDSFT